MTIICDKYKGFYPENVVVVGIIQYPLKLRGVTRCNREYFLWPNFINTDIVNNNYLVTWY